MYSSHRLTTSFLSLNRRCSVYIRDSFRVVVRQFVASDRAIDKQRASSRRFSARVKSVQKFSRKIREILISKERLKMSGDNSQILAPLQAAVKEKVRLVGA